MFDLKEFILNTLINGVKNKTFAKEYANTLAINYMSKGLISAEDIQAYDEATTTVEEIEQEENIESTEEVAESEV